MHIFYLQRDGDKAMQIFKIVNGYEHLATE